MTARSAREDLFQEASSLDELGNRVGDLHQVIDDLECVWVFAVGVLESVSPVLLNVRAFVFNFPTSSAPFV